MIKHASLFTGIGGFDVAAQQLGWQNVLQCENNPFCQQVLRYYWPKAKLYADIKTTDFTKYRRTIDVLSGGFPCQPYSLAGKRLGKADARHLWPQMLRAIREIQPPWVVGENVCGLLSWNRGLVFHEIQTDLEAEGYQVLPFLLPASSVGAPHQRYRIWFIAHRPDAGLESLLSWQDLFSGLTDATYTDHQRQPERTHGAIPNTQGQSARVFTPKYTRNPWVDFPTQSPVCSRNDGFSAQMAGTPFFGKLGIDHPRQPAISAAKHRQESIHGYGNAVVPHLVLQLFQVIDQFIHSPTQ